MSKIEELLAKLVEGQNIDATDILYHAIKNTKGAIMSIAIPLAGEIKLSNHDGKQGIVPQYSKREWLLGVASGFVGKGGAPSTPEPVIKTLADSTEHTLEFDEKFDSCGFVVTLGAGSNATIGDFSFRMEHKDEDDKESIFKLAGRQKTKDSASFLIICTYEEAGAYFPAIYSTNKHYVGRNAADDGYEMKTTSTKFKIKYATSIGVSVYPIVMNAPGFLTALNLADSLYK